MSPNARLITAVGIALLFGIPALFAAPWRSAGLLMFLLNLPGVLLAVPHLPPEGYPGQSALHAILLLIVQVVVWFIMLTVLSAIRRRASDPRARKA